MTRVARPGMTADYTYRPDGLRLTRRIGAAATTITHIWDGGHMVAERNHAGGVINRFDRGAGQRVVRSEQHGFYLYNFRGDVVQRTNASGAVTHTYRYTAFGNELPGGQSAGTTAANPSNNPWRFAGMYWDAERSEYMTPNRMFNPRLGRWTQPDPFWGIHNMQGSNAAILQSSNLFMFVMHNPVRFVDPTGLFALLASSTSTDGPTTLTVTTEDGTTTLTTGDSGTTITWTAAGGATTSSTSVLGTSFIPGASRGLIHNWVVWEVAARNNLLHDRRVTSSAFRRTWGVVDLVSARTGEVWEVKRSTLSVSSAQAQLARYTAEDARLTRNNPAGITNMRLIVGGSAGTVIPSGSFTEEWGFHLYTLDYWDLGNGIIQYDFTRSINWQGIYNDALLGCAIALALLAGNPEPALRLLRA